MNHPIDIDERHALAPLKKIDGILYYIRFQRVSQNLIHVCLLSSIDEEMDLVGGFEEIKISELITRMNSKRSSTVQDIIQVFGDGDSLNKKIMVHLRKICGKVQRVWMTTDFNEDEDFFTPHGKFKPKALGEYLLQKYKVVATSEKSTLWLYNPELGIWESNGKEGLQAECVEILGEKWNSGYSQQAIQYVRHSNYVDINELGKHDTRIVMKNGVFNLETRELTKFDPEMYAIQCLPITYNPEAKCPKVIKFIEEIVGNDTILTILEIFGSIIDKTPNQKLVIFVGEGANGKSTLLLVLINFVGERNIASATLQDLAQGGFRTAQLYGKLANLCGDIPAKPLKYTGILKQLTGGDPILVENKYEDPFMYFSYAKPIFSCNLLPATWDDTHAFHRRMVTIDFPYKFNPEDPTTKKQEDLIAELTTDEELSGLFNEALKGLMRFNKRQRFTTEKTTDEKRIEYIKKSDPVKYFCETMIETSTDNDYIVKDQAYTTYVKMVRDMRQENNNLRIVGNGQFTKLLKVHIQTYMGSAMIDGKQARVWRGLKWVNGVEPAVYTLNEPPDSLEMPDIDHVEHSLGPSWLKSGDDG